MATPSVEDYIKAVYKVASEKSVVSTQDIAERVGVTAPAVSKMIRRLSELRLTTHTPYQGVQLTEAGEKMALEIIRHHRLLEKYLVEALGYSWDEVHQEAERLEHHISETFEARIDEMLGFPAFCPHGDPIPTREGKIQNAPHHALALQIVPARLKIYRVQDTDSELLRHLKKLGLLPGASIEFLEQEPFGGAYLIRVGDEVVRVAPKAAQSIFVEDPLVGSEALQEELV